MSTLIIALPLSDGDTDTRYEHLLTTPDGQGIAAQSSCLASLLPDSGRAAGEIVAVVGPQAMSWHRVELPKGIGAGSARLRPVLQSLLEDRLLDDPQDVHLACEPSPAGGASVWVGVCNKAWLRGHLQVLEAAGRPVSRIVPECAPHRGALQVHALGEPGQAHVLLDGEPVAGGVLRLPLTAATVGAFLGHESLAQADAVLAEPAVAELAETLLQRKVEIQQRPQRLLLAAQSPWDLAQFDLANTSRTRSLKKLLGAGQALLRAPQWRAARWGAALLLLANLAGLNAWAWKEQSSWQSRRQAIDGTLTRTFPAVKVVVDAPVQMAREVAALRQATGAPSGGDLEVMLAAVGTALPPGKALSGIDFAAGELRLKGLQLATDELAAVAAKLRPMGYAVNPQADGLQIRHGAAP